MALLEARLKQKIKTAFQTEQTEEQDHNAALDRIAAGLAKAIVEEILSLTVTVAAGIPVSTAGSAAAQTGATTAPQIATLT